MTYIDPTDRDALNQIQKKSGLNRGDFGRIFGYSYDSFKEFYSGRSTIQPHLRRALIMYQLLSKTNRRVLCDIKLI